MHYDNLNSQRVNRWKYLLTQKGRQKSGSMLIEGINSCELLIKHCSKYVETVIVDFKFVSQNNERIDRLIKELKKLNIEFNTATREIIDKVSVDAAGIFAVVKAEIEISKSDIPQNSAADTLVICYRTQDPGNCGAIIRACAALDVKKVIFTDNSVNHWNPKVVRSSAGGVFLTPISNIETAQNAIKYAKDLGYTVIAADGYGTKKVKAQLLNSDNIQNTLHANNKSDTKKIAWIFGNEANGLPTDIIDLCDKCVKIPISNAMESINLAGAVHICIWETNKDVLPPI